MDRNGWKTDPATKILRDQIHAYVGTFIKKDILRIPFGTYREFMKSGSRKEFEEAYFNIRKQLTALGLYLQWNDPSQDEKEYFNELLWSVSNEFTWCLAAHLSYGDNYFMGDPETQIDLFSAETAETLSELLILHKEIIDSYIYYHIRKRIKERVIDPFLEKQWSWETSLSNWCAVCSGSVGMTALLLEEKERRDLILSRVDKALEVYLTSFGESGASEEGIGYWSYGFGYYIYYIAMRLELDSDYHLSDETIKKIKKIAEFPYSVQIKENLFVPFSDASSDTIIPTGLISYLYKKFGATPPYINQITPFDFEHCYRFAHISRNLWWTDKNIFCLQLTDMSKFYEEKQWLLQRKENCFLAVKGGNNKEEHNHNDVGSFILAYKGELYLTDLGAGPYTADYFGSKRYQYPHTRSYWHNVPNIQLSEQVQTDQQCIIKELEYSKEKANITMELSMFYQISELQSFCRCIEMDMVKHKMILEDHFEAKKYISAEEGLISRFKPEVIEEGLIVWKGSRGQLSLIYDSTILKYNIDSKKIANHRNQIENAYRLGLKMKKPSDTIIIRLEFVF